MAHTPDAAALKTALRDRMRSLEEAELAEAVAHYESFLNDARLDGREAHDKDDIADARESADLAAAFDHPVHTHQVKIDAIEAADFSLTDSVKPGAVVSFGNRHFIVLVSTTRFECAGRTYMGISPLSPIYRAMEGLKAGDSFAFNGREITLQDVF